MPSSSTHLPDFVRLGDGVWYHKPSSTREAQPIHLVILCTWMGAALRHISKYTAQYRSMLPDAQILVVQSGTDDIMWRSQAFQKKRMAPAQQVIRAAASTHGSQKPQILMHIFSNGGCQTSCQLASQFGSDSGTTIPLKAMLIDSAPGKASFRPAVNALSAIVPKTGITHFTGMLLVYLGLLMMWAYVFATGKEFMVDRVRHEMNSGQLFGMAVPRTYIFSKADKLIDWKEVEEHIAAARASGYSVREENFESSDHVAHAVLDKERYWRVVQDAYQ